MEQKWYPETRGREMEQQLSHRGGVTLSMQVESQSGLRVDSGSVHHIIPREGRDGVGRPDTLIGRDLHH